MASTTSQLLWAILTSSAGLMADGYDLAVVDLIITTLGHLYPDDIRPAQKSLIASTTYVGIILGMVSFGVLADITGHKATGLATAALTGLGCALSACCAKGRHFNIAYQLALCRFLLGVGIGGEYPVSMTLGSGKEGCCFRQAGLSKGQRLSVNVLMIAIGSMLAPALSTCLLAASVPPEVVWQALVLCGLLPSVAAFAARLHLPAAAPAAHSPDESGERHEAGAAAAAGGAARSFWRKVRLQGAVLLGCCSAWGLHNFAFFGATSFRSLIYDRMFGVQYLQSYRAVLEHEALFGLWLSLASVLVGVGLVVTVDRASLFWVQLCSFFGFAAIAGLCGLLLGPSPGWLLLCLMCLWMAFLTTAGNTCYLVPAQSFLPEVSATCCGIAAASGKVGALVGTALFPLIEHAWGLAVLLWVCCGVGVLGAASTLVLTPREMADPSEQEELKSDKSSWYSSPEG